MEHGNPTPLFAAEKTEAEKTEDGVHVKVTFANGTTANFELDPVQGVDLVMQIGTALDKHRAQNISQVGGS